MTTTPDMTPADLAVTPEPIMTVAAGFMAAKHLFAASELGLFEALADAPATLQALASRIGLTPRAARISADAMVALGLLERHGDTYRNSPVADRFLAGRPQPDLRPLLRFWDRISYPAWQDLAGSLGRGPRQEIFELDETLQEVASAGIEAVLAGPAAALAHTYDFATHSQLLDVGGGTGSWSIAALQAHPRLSATVVDLPVVAAVARSRVSEAGLQERIEIVAGDAMHGELPTGHDVVLVANLAHYWSPEQNRQLLRRIRAAATPDARLLLADFWTDATHTSPAHAALMAGEFAVHLENGDVYSIDEVRSWLRDTGWRFLEHRGLAGPQSLVVAAADP